MASTMTTMQNSKKALRKAMSVVLHSLSESAIEQQSRSITTHILSSPFFKRSKCISCYLSMSGEANTSALTKEILHSGRSLFVPNIEKGKDGIMHFLKVYDLDDLESLPSGVWGIKEPGPVWNGGQRMSAEESDVEILDVILLPGVAFDRNFSRLGHGKGYYDRFISSYFLMLDQRCLPRPLLVALALREQLLPDGDIPMASHDWKMDMIVTPDGILRQVPL